MRATRSLRSKRVLGPQLTHSRLSLGRKLIPWRKLGAASVTGGVMAPGSVESIDNSLLQLAAQKPPEHLLTARPRANGLPRMETRST
jgi:hypothetical protein